MLSKKKTFFISVLVMFFSAAIFVRSMENNLQIYDFDFGRRRKTIFTRIFSNFSKFSPPATPPIMSQQLLPPPPDLHAPISLTFPHPLSKCFFRVTTFLCWSSGEKFRKVFCFSGTKRKEKKLSENSFSFFFFSGTKIIVSPERKLKQFLSLLL